LEINQLNSRKPWRRFKVMERSIKPLTIFQIVNFQSHMTTLTLRASISLGQFVIKALVDLATLCLLLKSLSQDLRQSMVKTFQFSPHNT
jgi:hypothetical protein